MKLSVSLPDSMAREIQQLAKNTERNVSWLIQKAWDIARPKLFRGDEEAGRRKAIGKFKSLKGALRKDYPNGESVMLAKQAFRLK